MNRLFIVTLMMLLSAGFGFAQGAMVVNASNASCFRLTKASVDIQINNQVAIVTSTAHFKNTFSADTNAKFVFPMPEDANAIGLRWYQDSVWHQASFNSTDPDTTLPGGGGGSTSATLTTWMGATPLFFQPDSKIRKDSTIIIELKYVQLLPYAYSYVNIHFPSKFATIQSAPLDTFACSIHLVSARTIDEFAVQNPQSGPVFINDSLAQVQILKTNTILTYDVDARYKLAPAETGLFSFSTYLPDSMIVCDTFGRGYFAFIVEPNTNDSVVIQKDFILIIDHSGSMSGNKITQAKEAAKLIVNNLNPGDRFNIVKFETVASEFQTGLVDFNASTQASAINYINAIGVAGTTCVSCAFSMAIPQFATSDPDAAKIVIFFTDGQANVGISDNAGILNLVNNLANTYAPDMNLHTFGVGTGVNTQLLSQLAQQHNGQAGFIDDVTLYQTITDFYFTIQNPVLLNTSMTFDPPVIYETYPMPLPNLYGGQQLLVVGRYNTPGWVEVTFQGTAFGDPVSYVYDFLLADTVVDDYFFLPKIWAKKKIDHMTAQYYLLSPTSVAALNLEKDIKELSVCNGVMSVFTGFTDDTPPSEIDESEESVQQAITWPNPFSDRVSIDVTGLFDTGEELWLEIYGMDGKLIYRSSAGDYAGTTVLLWNACDMSGTPVSDGMYFFRVYSENRSVTGKISRFQ